jgi:hypothetical protein
MPDKFMKLKFRSSGKNRTVTVPVANITKATLNRLIEKFEKNERILETTGRPPVKWGNIITRNRNYYIKTGNNSNGNTRLRNRNIPNMSNQNTKNFHNYMQAKTNAITRGILFNKKQPGVGILQFQNIVKAGNNNHAYTHTHENAMKQKILNLLKKGNEHFLKVLAEKKPNLVDNNGRFYTHRIPPSTLYQAFKNNILHAKQKNEQNNTSRKFGTMALSRVLTPLLGQNARYNFMKRTGGLGNYALTGNRPKTPVQRGKFARMFGLPQKKLNLTEMLNNNLPPKRSFFAKSRGLPRRNRRRNSNNFNSI